jgi:hypothetical protein
VRQKTATLRHHHGFMKRSGLTQFMSFRGARRREIAEIIACQASSQGFLAPVVARNDIRMVNCLSPEDIGLKLLMEQNSEAHRDKYHRYQGAWVRVNGVLIIFRMVKNNSNNRAGQFYQLAVTPCPPESS